MPQKPTLLNPAVPEPLTLTEVGRAVDSGSVRFFRDSDESPTPDQASSEEGNFLLPWNALLRINSA